MPWSNESRQSRGYGAEWEKIRRVVIERDKGMCQECARRGRVVMGRDVDHKVSRAAAKRMGWTEEQTENIQNLQLLCTLCHNEKTTRETGRTYRTRPTYDPETGWIIEGS